MGKSITKRERLRKEKLRRRKKRLIIAAVAVAVVAAAAAAILLLRPDATLSSRNPQVAALREYILADKSLESRAGQKSPYVAFLSLSDSKNRAKVVHGTGSTLKSALDDADRKAWEIVKEEKLDVVWAKADIVNNAREINTMDLQDELLGANYRFFYRRGISFDNRFDAAFLEAELNGNRIYRYYQQDQITAGEVDYSTPAFNTNNFNNYLASAGLEKRSGYPDRITTFTTIGYFCGEDGNVLELYDSGLDYGRRVIDMVDDKVAAEVVSASSRYLAGQIGSDGRFKYGHFPIFDNEMTGYNTIRHVCATWSLLNHYYRLTGDESIIPSVDASIEFMLGELTEYADNGVAWLIDRTSGEVRLGGNAMAIVMLTEYMDLLGTDKHTGLVRQLADGILELQDSETGKFYHVLNASDFSRKEEFRIIYYDGEATFALARAYSLTHDSKYLEAAIASVENFIANNYTRYTDHWVAYSMNEVTKHVDDPRYYEFAMLNISNNLNRIYKRETSFHTYMELLMAGWETYNRLMQRGVEIEFPDNFDLEYFAQTIYKRARHMLNGYFYPEYAMYMRYPDTIIDSFFVRHHDYRVRIDDVQHFVGGYYNYIRYYDEILPHLSAEFLSEINSQGLGYYDKSAFDVMDVDDEDFDE
ncbi:MAG: hypothetical protein FWG48_03620 [Oscillospiraceae bacterium]|nr:hypothetical protein [Oscillospiraceae bacterium]